MNFNNTLKLPEEIPKQKIEKKLIINDFNFVFEENVNFIFKLNEKEYEFKSEDILKMFLKGISK